MTWVVMFAVGLGSFVFRLSPQLLLERITLSERADAMIRHAGTAAITALIVVSTKQSAATTGIVPAVLAVAVAAVLAARGASLLRVVLGGVAVYACVLLVAGILPW